MRYDREKLALECEAWFRQSPQKRVPFHELLRFARVRAHGVFRGRPADADDLAGYFLEKLWVHWNRPHLDPTPWLVAPLACLNQFFQCRARDYLRREAVCPATFIPNHEGTTHVDELEANETRRDVQALVATLPRPSQEAYRIRFVEDLSPRDAARALAWEVTQVYQATAELKRLVRRSWSGRVAA